MARLIVSPLAPKDSVQPGAPLQSASRVLPERSGFSIHEMVVNDHATQVAMTGVGDPTVLLLHAVGLDWSMWRAVMRALYWHATTIAYDLRGFGSAAGVLPADMGCQADEAAEIVCRLGLRSVHVVGVSFGGVVAQYMALRHRALVRSLGLVATIARAPEGAMEGRAVRAEAMGAGSWVDETLERWFTTDELSRRGPGVEYARQRLRRVSVENWASGWRALEAVDVLEQLRSVNVPAVVVAGEKDTAAPVVVMQDIAQRLPRGSLEVIPNAAHMLALEQPKRLARVLQRSLAAAAARSSTQRRAVT